MGFFFVFRRGNNPRWFKTVRSVGWRVLAQTAHVERVFLISAGSAGFGGFLVFPLVGFAGGMRLVCYSQVVPFTDSLSQWQ